MLLPDGIEDALKEKEGGRDLTQKILALVRVQLEGWAKDFRETELFERFSESRFCNTRYHLNMQEEKEGKAEI